MAALAIQADDRPAAAPWFQRSAEAGDPAGYDALTQLAWDAGDEAAEIERARLGANAGDDFCIARHGLNLAMFANGDQAALR